MTEGSIPSEIIHHILLDEWDPIGVSGIEEAQDEYDSYINDVLVLLGNKATEQEFFNFLWSIETEHMGLTGDKDLTKKIASKLAQIRLGVSAP